jgi:hypothetical protein
MRGTDRRDICGMRVQNALPAAIAQATPRRAGV